MNTNSRNLTLLTDLYELTMMQGYFKTHSKEHVVFDVFYRQNPCGGAYAIACGLDQAIDYIKDLHFEQEDIDYLRSTGFFQEDFLDYLKNFRFTGDIYAIPEGTIYGARAAVIAGCIGTSNVLAGQMFDIPVKGTHAHSWIMSFPSELEAFRTYAELFPDNCLLLVDTYDTLNSGVKHAIQVFREMREKGIHSKLFGIRLDSGDLAYLTKKARIMLDEAGFPDAIISASSDLDEYLINSLINQGAKITSWGVGTNLITSKDCPSFGGVYKLACIIDENGTEIPKIKVSENVEKVTNPGNKKILRIYDKASGKIKADLITLEDEVFTEDQPLTLFDPLATWKRTRLEAGTYTIRELLVPIFKNGQCVYESPSVMDIQAYCTQEKATLWDESKRLINPQEVYVDLSRKLYDLKNQLLDDAHTIKD